MKEKWAKRNLKIRWVQSDTKMRLLSATNVNSVGGKGIWFIFKIGFEYI